MSERKVWVVQLPTDYEYPYKGEVMIEQFGDEPPTLAFRPYPSATWGLPLDSEAR